MLKILAIATQFLPTLLWFSAAVRDAVDAESDGGKKLTPDEAADLADGLVGRVTPILRTLGE